MKTPRMLVLVMAVVLLVSVLCVWYAPSVQDFMAGNKMWNGIRDFCAEFDAVNIDSLAELPEPAEGAVLVSIPYIEYGAGDLEMLKDFVGNGGTLLLMDDYGYGNGLLEYLGLDVRFTNRPLLDPLFCYKNQSMPRITDFAPGMADDELEVIVLNHASSLQVTDGMTVVARSSGTSFLDTNDDGLRDAGEPAGPLPVAAEGRLGRGRVIVAADPSLIINAMAGAGDNYAFIRSLLAAGGEPETVLVDRARLPEAPLDTSQAGLGELREIISSPYALVAMTAAIFALTAGYTMKKGDTGD